ncbi:hypothetical protein ABIA96_000612 [Bradyrhizobium sp. LB11.1]
MHDDEPSRIVPRGTIMGKQVEGTPLTEATRYRRCPDCSGFLDIFDLGAVLDHEGPHECPPADRVH